MNQNSDCLECRLVSGFGLLGASAYVLHHGRKLTNTFSRITVSTFGIAIGITALLRLTNMPPFRKKLSQVEKLKEEDPTACSDYIVGKFPRKLT